MISEACDSAGDLLDGCEIEPCSGTFDGSLEVFGKAAVAPFGEAQDRLEAETAHRGDHLMPLHGRLVSGHSGRSRRPADG